MIQVDQQRCAYCGGCVSVCPVEALNLAETRLLVSDECIDCGDCLSACPVGALLPEGSLRRADQTPSRQDYDLVVIGAGPGGSMAALTAAQAGLSVLLLEKRQEIGSPVRCAEGIAHEQLAAFLEPDQAWIAAEVREAELTNVTPSGPETLHASGGHGYILERRIFDRALAEQAARAGAEVRVKSSASSLLMENGRVHGVQLQPADYFNGTGTAEIYSQVIIAADGVESQVGRWAGLDTQLYLKDTMVCLQYLLAGIDIDPRCTCYTLDPHLAPGGYAWVFPKGEGKANVGLGVQGDLWQAEVESLHSQTQPANTDSVLGFLNRFIEGDSRLAQGYPVDLIAGNVPVALSPRRIVMDGLMLVGDAARQVDPLTGGGIANAMQAGQLAARVAVAAIEAGNTSAEYLQRYPEQWGQSTGRKLQRNYRLREKFPLQQRNDQRFVQAFLLAAGG
jgi:digeranylgeranylglycerophospholipid reductase